MTRNRIVLIVGGLIVIAAGAGGYIYLRKGGEASASETGARIDSIAASGASGAETGASSDLAVAVEGAPVQQGTMVISVTAAGEAAAWRQAVVSSLVGGEVRSLNVRESGAVEGGTMLVAIDSTQYQIALSEAQAGLRQAEATFREMTLFDDRIEASVRAERQKTARVKSGLDREELRVEKAMLDLSRTRMSAPWGGRIASIKVVPGQWVNQGAELMTLVDISRIKVDVQVLESEVVLLTPGRSARVTFAAFPGEVFNGRIETINPLVDKQRFARVVVSLPNPGGKILPGMYARVALDARQLANRVFVPRTAILERDNPRRKLLFVFEGDDTRGLAKWRYVATGAENETMVEIIEDDDPSTEMVKAGEIVLIAGHHTLAHDARIRMVESVSSVEGVRRQ